MNEPTIIVQSIKTIGSDFPRASESEKVEKINSLLLKFDVWLKDVDETAYAFYTPNYASEYSSDPRLAEMEQKYPGLGVTMYKLKLLHTYLLKLPLILKEEEITDRNKVEEIRNRYNMLVLTAAFLRAITRMVRSADRREP